MKHMSSIEHIVMAISPETQQVTAYHIAGHTSPVLGQPQLPLYRPINHQGQIHTLEQLKSATYAQGQPVQEYVISKTHHKADDKQRRLW